MARAASGCGEKVGAGMNWTPTLLDLLVVYALTGPSFASMLVSVVWAVLVIYPAKRRGIVVHDWRDDG